MFFLERGEWRVILSGKIFEKMDILKDNIR